MDRQITAVPITYDTWKVQEPTWCEFCCETGPRLSYVMAALPRSGSNLLMRQLCRAGVGMPAEYLQPYVMEPFTSHNGIRSADFGAYLQFLVTVRQTESGIFGIKAHWEQFEPVSTGIVFNTLKPDRYIFTRRHDIAAQAVSLERAFQTGKWDPRWEPNLGSRDAAADPEDLERLLKRCRLIAEEERSWASFFGAHSIVPLQVFYEDLLEDHDAVLQSVFDFLGVKAEVPVKEPAPSGKTGEIGRDKETVNLLRAQLELEPIERPSLGD
jgi:LPS sulfotransferase NodH